MTITIATTRRGRMTRGPARSRRRTPVGLESLEPRLMLAGHAASPSPGQRWLIPAQAASGAAVAFVGPISSTDPEPVVGARSPGAEDAGTAPEQTNDRTRPPDAPPATTRSGQTVAGGNAGLTITSSTTPTGVGYGPTGNSSSTTPTGVGCGSPGSLAGSGAASGPTSTGPGPPTSVGHAGPAPGPPASPVATAEAAPSSTGFGRATTPSPLIGAGPLPASPYEPAGGIFRVVGPTAASRVDRVEETRVEMSLVRLVSPEPGGSREDGRLPLPDPEASPAYVASDSAPPRPGGRSVVLPLGPIAAGPALLASADPVPDTPQVVAATSPPTDGPDRPTDAATAVGRGDAIDRDGRMASRFARREAIFLGLGGSVVLGFGLYAPDLARSVRPAGPRPSPRPRPRRRSRADRRRSWPAPPSVGD